MKERIIEYLAVQQRTDKVKRPDPVPGGPAPGVGKTSLGKSVGAGDRAEFCAHQSLGGIRDEAEIRGHRRTYIGSLPGKIIQSMKKAKTSNPLFLLDEVDKMGTDFRGDPASALLEVLDPEQNSTFNDHYLEVDYDLIRRHVRDHGEHAQHPAALARPHGGHPHLRGYTEDEKVEIAKRHLITKQDGASAGLKDGEWSISDDALRDVIRLTTRAKPASAISSVNLPA